MSTSTTANSHLNGEDTISSSPGGTKSDRPFTIISGPGGRYYLTENDELFSQCDTSLLIPSSSGQTGEATSDIIKKRVIRARSHDLPEVWYTYANTEDGDTQTYRMGMDIAVQLDHFGTIYGSRAHGRTTIDQVDKLEREEWISETINLGNLSVDPEQKSMIEYVIERIPATKDDKSNTAREDAISMMRFKLGLVYDYAIRPIL
ncbi:uncharacterized protein L199_001621 [Kwoniella botswanensis]|uniref:uncharacterized protein n=1 Tax=Kwoniella botswanensis TaxID=1268659 RepID=UPI00315CA7EA